MTSVSVGIRHRESWLQTSDGTRLFNQSWTPEAPKALVVIIHGFAEHSSRHASAALHLARSGCAVHAFDLRGHGRSQGKRCYVSAFDEYLDDTQAVFLSATHEWPDRPTFLLAHSLGGLIGSLFVIDQRGELSGLILSAPAVKLGRDYSKFKILACLVLGRLFPHLPMVRFRSSSVSRDSVIVQGYREDELVYHGRTPARTASEIVRAIRRAQLGAGRISVPLLVMHGSHDQVAELEGSRELHARAQSLDKSMRVYDGLYHEIMHEPEQALVLDEMAAWLDARTARLMREALDGGAAR
jgi:acylglycerol lipase